MEPIHGFQSEPLTQNFVENFSVTWPQRTIRRGISENGDTTTDDHYKMWIHLQQTEQDEFVKNQKTRSLLKISM